MTTINNLYTQSQLALAAYATLSPNIAQNRGALISAGMTGKQTDIFLGSWQVVDQFNDEGLLGTGLSATVFREKATPKERGQVLPFAPCHCHSSFRDGSPATRPISRRDFTGPVDFPRRPHCDAG